MNKTIDQVTGGPEGSQSARFVLETRTDPDLSLLRQALAENFGMNCALEPVFDGDDDEESRRFVSMTVAGMDGNDVSELFSFAYRIQESLELRSCEPDIECDTGYEDASRKDSEESGFRGALGCWVDKPAPSDSEWAIKSIRAKDAWKVDGQEKPEGEGILIGQIDTGFSEHKELSARNDVSLLEGANFVEGGFSYPIDPLKKGAPWDQPGHGLATASVVVSGKTGAVTGSSPKAKIVPIRSIRSVIRISQTNVAKGIDFARRSGCHVITMSLGGLPSKALRTAIRRAVRENIIVLAAAGNCVKAVTYPARYDDCIAVAGSNFEDEPWIGSCRGTRVDVSAPAELVYQATRIDENGDITPDKTIVRGGQGTSYAVALTAGVAALWLAHFGRDKLIGDLRSGETLQDRFRWLLSQSSRTPQGWDTSKFGAGIVDALGLLTTNPFADGGEATPIRAAKSIDRDEVAEEIGSMVAEVTGMRSDDLAMNEAQRSKFGLELAYRCLDRSSNRRADGVEESGESRGTGVSKELLKLGSQSESYPLKTLLRGVAGTSRHGEPRSQNGGSSNSGIKVPSILIPDTTLNSVSNPWSSSESSPRDPEGMTEPLIEFGRNGSAIDERSYKELCSRIVRQDRRSKAWANELPSMDSPSVVGAAESIIGSVDGRERIYATDQDPWRRICCLNIVFSGGRALRGTGWFVGPRTVITAGHCVYSHRYGGWPEKIEVIPGRDGSRRPFDSVWSTQFSSVRRWVESEQRGYDIGAIHLDATRPVGDKTGWFGIGAYRATDLMEMGMNVAGYPVDGGRRSRWRGETLAFDSGYVIDVDQRRVYYDADTNGGTSGAPVWVYNESNQEPVVVGVHAYGEGGTPSRLNIEANSAPRITPDIFELIMGWKSQ